MRLTVLLVLSSMVLWMCNNRNSSHQIENFGRYRLGSASGFISFKSVHACKRVSSSRIRNCRVKLRLQLIDYCWLRLCGYRVWCAGVRLRSSRYQLLEIGRFLVKQTVEAVLGQCSPSFLFRIFVANCYHVLSMVVKCAGRQGRAVGDRVL